MTEVYGIDATENAKHKIDFETNYKSTAVKITGITIAETSYETEMDFDNFKALVATPITWADVKYIEDSQKYILYLIS
jgi:hypothetical protein